MISKSLCLKCKGKLLCGLNYCPLLRRQETHKKILTKTKDSFTGSSPPSAFVSWTNYPKIAIAPLTPPAIQENTEFLDSSEQWFGLPAQQIIDFRESLVRPYKKFDAYSAQNPSYELMQIQEINMAEKSTSLEINLSTRLKTQLDFYESTAPLGPVGIMKSFSLQENPRISPKIEKATSDTDALSSTTMYELYNHFTPSTIYKVLSVGLLGVQRNRRLVPTRWAITAVDQNLSKQNIEKIKEFSCLDNYRLYHSSYLGNYFYILLLPDTWAFEQMEQWQPNTIWTEGNTTVMADSEPYKGRTSYPTNTEGAYFASRLSITEHLLREKKQASAIVFRTISDEYKQPLGVWVIRETVKDALLKPPLHFSSLENAKKFLSQKISKEMLRDSITLKNYSSQRKISSWFGAS